MISRFKFHYGQLVKDFLISSWRLCGTIGKFLKTIRPVYPEPSEWNWVDKTFSETINDCASTKLHVLTQQEDRSSLTLVGYLSRNDDSIKTFIPQQAGHSNWLKFLIKRNEIFELSICHGQKQHNIYILYYINIYWMKNIFFHIPLLKKEIVFSSVHKT